MEQILKRVFKRINAIDTIHSDEFCSSYIILFKEFLRRLSLANEYFQSSGVKLLPIDYKSFKITEEVNDKANELFSEFSAFKFGIGGIIFIHNYAFWEIFKAEYFNEIPDEISDLYEPVIRILERGGYINREMKIFDVCGAENFIIDNKYFGESAFIKDFSDNNLDLIDGISDL